MSIRQQFNLQPNKPTILIATDSALSHTGLGRLAREIFTYLHDTGEYNIVQHGWFHRGSSEQVKFPIIATKARPDGSAEPGDLWGQQSFDEISRDLCPNLVWMCADPWRLDYMKTVRSRGSYATMAYVAIDSPPIQEKDAEILRHFDDVVPYCE